MLPLQKTVFVGEMLEQSVFQLKHLISTVYIFTLSNFVISNSTDTSCHFG
jgi:hypothetical protein